MAAGRGLHRKTALPSFSSPPLCSSHEQVTFWIPGSRELSDYISITETDRPRLSLPLLLLGAVFLRQVFKQVRFEVEKSTWKSRKNPISGGQTPGPWSQRAGCRDVACESLGTPSCAWWFPAAAAELTDEKPVLVLVQSRLVTAAGKKRWT